MKNGIRQGSCLSLLSLKCIRSLTAGGGWYAHAWILGLLTFLIPQDLDFTARDGGASESAAKLP